MRWNSSIVGASTYLLLAATAYPADVAVPYKAPHAPEAPPTQASGYIEIYTGWATTTHKQIGFGDADERVRGWPLGGAGRGTFWFAPNASLQIDAQAEGTSYRRDGTAGHFSTHTYLVGGHLNWRDAQRGLLGIFGGAGDAGGNGLTGTSVRHGLIGAEGQLYWNALTLYLQGGYDRTVSPIDSFVHDQVHAWFVRGTGRWFIDPNLMIEATGLYADGAVEYAGTAAAAVGGRRARGFQTWLWQAKLEWRPGTLPLSFFAKYRGSETRWDTLNVDVFAFDQKVTDHRVLAGVRLYLAQGTLLSNDRTGATLDIIDPLGLPTSPTMFGVTQGLFASDQRLKRDIALLARRDDGLGLYRYRYLWSDEVYVGVMAQDVAELYPAAVVRGADGYLRVHYGQLGLKFLTFAEWLTDGVR